MHFDKRLNHKISDQNVRFYSDFFKRKLDGIPHNSDIIWLDNLRNPCLGVTFDKGIYTPFTSFFLASRKYRLGLCFPGLGLGVPSEVSHRFKYFVMEVSFGK